MRFCPSKSGGRHHQAAVNARGSGFRASLASQAQAMQHACKGKVVVPTRSQARLAPDGPLLSSSRSEQVSFSSSSVPQPGPGLDAETSWAPAQARLKNQRGCCSNIGEHWALPRGACGGVSHSGPRRGGGQRQYAAVSESNPQHKQQQVRVGGTYVQGGSLERRREQTDCAVGDRGMASRRCLDSWVTTYMIQYSVNGSYSSLSAL